MPPSREEALFALALEKPAEQREPVRRRVALKIIQLGTDPRQGVARVEAERQALARMDHPNIARLLEAGWKQKLAAFQQANPAVEAIPGQP